MRDLTIVHLRALVFWDGKLPRLSYLGLHSLLLAATVLATLWLQGLGYSNLDRLDGFYMLLLCPLPYYAVNQLGGAGAFLAFPIAWISLCLAVKRVRDLEWPETTVLLMFIPLASTALMGALSVLPGWRAWEIPQSSGPLIRGCIGQFVPRSKFGSGLFAVMATTFLMVLCSCFSTQVLEQYGWTLFVVLPIFLGLVCSVLHGFHHPKTFGQCFGIGVASAAAALFVLLGMQLEGLICVAMALPLLTPFLLLGCAIGYGIQLRPDESHRRTRALQSIFLWPLLLIGERVAPVDVPLLRAETSVLIEAPPETVWRNVVSFSELPPPKEWLFQTGVAFPIRATIKGEGVGAVRYCEFSTGPFIEPIEVWQEPSLLRFKVTHNPPVMKELNPFGESHPPHLRGFLESRRGQFRLIPMPGNRTLLIGTTWYQHRISPQPYWELWSDQIIHTIHLRVLGHIKRLSESRD